MLSGVIGLQSYTVCDGQQYQKEGKDSVVIRGDFTLLLALQDDQDAQRILWTAVWFHQISTDMASTETKLRSLWQILACKSLIRRGWPERV